MFIKKQSWTVSFTAIMKILRLGGKIVPTNTNSFRLISDIEIPTWTPTLPSNINCIKSDVEEIDGEWIYPNNIKNINKHNKYIMYIHGGAFCMCKAGTHRGLLFRIAKKTNSVIFSFNYRRSPEFKHPIPLDDCVKGYLYLLNKVKNSEKIILAGDSAGGNLVINLMAKLINHDLPIPSKCILISPWTDLTDYGNNSSWKCNDKYDFIRPELAKYFSQEYIDLSKNNLYDVSPLYLSDEVLSKFPPILVEYGECEVLHDQIEQFCIKIEKLGVNINYNSRPDMTHVFPLFHFTGIPQSKDFFDSTIKFVG
jgi:monoterpene epsilon-lactone hydrolase